MNDSLPVGLDIGSLNSCICVSYDTQMFTLSDRFGNNQIPTCVAFLTQERLYGSMAREYFNENGKTTLYDFKRFIGKCFSQEDMRKIQFTTPYQLELPPNRDSLRFPILLKNKKYHFSPEELLSMHLEYLKKLITNRCSSKRLSCVIGIPICYTQEQKDALLSACELAGLDDVQLLEEPVAIATAYALREPSLPPLSNASRHVAFVSIGYVHTQVAICSFNDNRMKILATSSDNKLGGLHFDQILYDILYKTLVQDSRLELPQSNSHSNVFAHLLSLLPRVKKILNREDVTISVPITNPLSNDTISVTLSRQEFQKKSASLIQRLRQKLNDCLQEAGLSTEQVDAVELLGGTCQIVEVAKEIREVLGKEVNWTWSSNEAVATGCAFHAVWNSTDGTVPWEILKSPGALSRDLLNRYKEEDKIFEKLEEEEKEKQENCNDLQTVVYSQMDAATPEKFGWIFEDERQKYIDDLEQMNEFIKSDRCERTKAAYNKVREELDNKQTSIEQISEKRRKAFECLSQLSNELNEKKALYEKLNEQTNLVKNLSNGVWSGRIYSNVQQVQTQLKSVSDHLNNVLPQWNAQPDLPEGYTTARKNPTALSNLPQKVIQPLLDQLQSITEHQEALERALAPVYKHVLYSLISGRHGNTILKVDAPQSFYQMGHSIKQMLMCNYKVANQLPTNESIPQNIFSSIKNKLPITDNTRSQNTAFRGSRDNSNEYVNKFVQDNCKLLCDTIDGFNKAWNKYAEIYSTQTKGTKLAEAIKELEGALSNLENDTSNFLKQLGNVVTDTNEIHQAVESMRVANFTVIKKVRKQLEDDARLLLKCFGELVDDIKRKDLITAEVNTKLQDLSESHSEFKRIAENFENTLKNWVKELPGYQALTPNRLALPPGTEV